MYIIKVIGTSPSLSPAFHDGFEFPIGRPNLRDIQRTTTTDPPSDSWFHQPTPLLLSDSIKALVYYDSKMQMQECFHTDQYYKK